MPTDPCPWTSSMKRMLFAGAHEPKPGADNRPPGADHRLVRLPRALLWLVRVLGVFPFVRTFLPCLFWHASRRCHATAAWCYRHPANCTNMMAPVCVAARVSGVCGGTGTSAAQSSRRWTRGPWSPAGRREAKCILWLADGHVMVPVVPPGHKRRLRGRPLFTLPNCCTVERR